MLPRAGDTLPSKRVAAPMLLHASILPPRASDGADDRYNDLSHPPFAHHHRNVNTAQPLIIRTRRWSEFFLDIIYTFKMGFIFKQIICIFFYNLSFWGIYELWELRKKKIQCSNSIFPITRCNITLSFTNYRIDIFIETGSFRLSF